MTNLKFYPEAAKDIKWDDIEIHPVHEDAEGIAEVVDEGGETYWSVYLHTNEGIVCIADVPTKEDALLLSELLNSIKKRD